MGRLDDDPFGILETNSVLVSVGVCERYALYLNVVNRVAGTVPEKTEEASACRPRRHNRLPINWCHTRPVVYEPIPDPELAWLIQQLLRALHEIPRARANRVPTPGIVGRQIFQQSDDPRGVVNRAHRPVVAEPIVDSVRAAIPEHYL